MSLPIAYGALVERHGRIRTFAGSVTSGNRCALVMGKTLHLEPGASDLTFAKIDGVAKELRGQPLLTSMFVKATDVARAIEAKYGTPEIDALGGRDALKTITGIKGLIYLEDCWRTPSEKVVSWFGIDGGQSGDHIDLWDGATLEIYRGKPGQETLVVRAKRVRLWKTIA